MSSYARIMGYKPVPFSRHRGGMARVPGGLPIPRGPARPRVRRGIYSKTALKAAAQTGLLKKRKQKRGRGKYAMGDSDKSSWIKSMKSNRLTKKIYSSMVGHQGVTNNYYGNYVSGLGQQSVGSFPLFSKTQLQEIKTACVGTTNNTAKVYIKSINTSITLRNQTTQPGRVRIYDIVCRRDTPSTTLDSPYECWAKGLTDLSGSTATPNDAFAHPNRSDEFRCYWKIARTHDVNLQCGDSYVHTVKIKCNRVLDTTVLDNAVGTSIGGWTHYVLVVHMGSLVNSNQDNNRVTYCSLKLDYIQSITTRFAYFEKNLATYTVNTRVPTTTNLNEVWEAITDTSYGNTNPVQN